MGFSWWGILLKFLCTSLVWGRWVTLALFDDIILLLKPFLLAGWPLPAWQNPVITPSHCPHTDKHILTAFHWEFFRRTLVYSFLLSQHTHTFSSLLCISHRGPQVAKTFWSVCVRDFGATCNFLLWDTDTSCIFSPYFCCVPPPSSLSKSRLEPVKGLMRLEFIRQWVGTAPCSPLNCWLSFWVKKTLMLRNNLCLCPWLSLSICTHFLHIQYVLSQFISFFLLTSSAFQCQVVNYIFKWTIFTVLLLRI